MNKHVFVLEIDIQIPRHIFIIWCMRRRFSAVLLAPTFGMDFRSYYQQDACSGVHTGLKMATFVVLGVMCNREVDRDTGS
jgi:hypothetical protein